MLEDAQFLSVQVFNGVTLAQFFVPLKSYLRVGAMLIVALITIPQWFLRRRPLAAGLLPARPMLSSRGVVFVLIWALVWVVIEFLLAVLWSAFAWYWVVGAAALASQGPLVARCFASLDKNDRDYCRMTLLSYLAALAVVLTVNFLRH